jgi:rare lipoprotein A
MKIIKIRPRSVFSVLLAIAALTAFCLYGCARRPLPSPIPAPPVPVAKPKPYKVMGKWYQPIPDARDYREKGIASWYGDDFQGRPTSSGEIYDMYAMTAAHKTLPLGTYVSVRNLYNNKQIEVKINDRGPFVRDRVIDLSYTGAKKLEVLGPGTAPVEIVALGAPPPSSGAWGNSRAFIPVDYYSGNFTIQVGAFTVLENAEKLKQVLEKDHENVHIVRYDDGNRLFYRVRVGLCHTLDKAVEYETLLVKKGFSETFVVAE